MDVFQYAATCEKNWEYNLSQMTDYERKYTFYSDFSIAEFCEVYKADKNAVKSTYKSVIEAWGSNIKAMAEVVMVLNHKIWSFYDDVDSSYLECGAAWKEYFQSVYQELYEKCVDYVYKHFGDDNDAMRYYYSVTD